MKKLDHIAIAVYSIEKERAFYERVLGLTLIDQEVIEDQQVKTAFFQAGETKLELIEPLTPDSPVGSFLEKKVRDCTTWPFCAAIYLKSLRHWRISGSN